MHCIAESLVWPQERLFLSRQSTACSALMRFRSKPCLICREMEAVWSMAQGGSTARKQEPGTCSQALLRLWGAFMGGWVVAGLQNFIADPSVDTGLPGC